MYKKRIIIKNLLKSFTLCFYDAKNILFILVNESIICMTQNTKLTIFYWTYRYISCSLLLSFSLLKFCVFWSSEDVYILNIFWNLSFSNQSSWKFLILQCWSSKIKPHLKLKNSLEPRTSRRSLQSLYITKEKFSHLIIAHY